MIIFGALTKNRPLIFTGLITALLLPLHAENCPRFLGGDQYGIIEVYEISTSWTADDNLKW
ncbi:MAG: hypothetical protein CMI18_05465 [Opitutaceae bacterium]|nr:hypothetical protein [Opitutaceae bacterium]